MIAIDLSRSGHIRTAWTHSVQLQPVLNFGGHDWTGPPVYFIETVGGFDECTFTWQSRPQGWITPPPDQRRVVTLVLAMLHIFVEITAG